MSFSSVRMLCKVLLCMATITSSVAHEDPENVVSSLTHNIDHMLLEKKGNDVDPHKKSKLANLYFLRAKEFVILGDRKKAHADLIKYTQLQPSEYTGWSELSRVEIDGNKSTKYLKRALKLASSNNEKSYVYYALTENAYETNQFQQALAYCNRSLTLAEGEKITKTLYKNHLLWRLGKIEERVEFLSKSLKTNASEILRLALIDSQLDAGQYEIVKQTIHREIRESRFKSSWLIRAARCEKHGSKQSKQYAQSAIDEILQRLHPARPDITLQMDLVQAYAILNDKKAQQYLDQIPDEEYTRLRKAELISLMK